MEGSDDAIIGKDLNGIITSWNRGAERIYGYAADEVVGKPVSVLVPWEKAGELPTIMDRLRHGERVDHFESERTTKDGRRIDVPLTISPIRAPDGTTELVTDPGRLRQILANLLSTAMKFTDEGTVEIGMDVDDDVVRIHVRDSGIGVPEELRERIFELAQ